MDRNSTSTVTRRGAPLAPVDIGVVRGDVIEDVTLCPRDADVTIGDVATALGMGELTVDGQLVSASTPIAASGLQRGSVLGGRAGASPPPPAALLRWVGGPDAGEVVGLGPGVVVVGRAPGVDIRRHEREVAPYSCIVGVSPSGEVAVTPLAPGVEAMAGARWRIGPGVVEVARPSTTVAVPVGAAHAGEWTVPLARPPRPAPAPPPTPIRAPRPDGGADAGRPGLTGLVTTVLSLAGGVVAAVLFGQPVFLLMGGLASAGSIGSWVVQRRRGTRAARAARRRAGAEAARFEAEVAAQADATAAQRRARAVDLAEAVMIATSRGRRLWERRADHDDHLEVVLGIGAVPWTPVVDGGGDEYEPPQVRLTDVPVTLALRPGVVLGIVGDADAARAVARSVTLQAAVTSGPVDVAVTVVPGRAIDAWRWAAWLPHAADLAADVGDRTRLVVVDGPDAVAARTSPVRSVLAGRAGPAAGIVVSGAADSLPSSCTHIVHVAADASVRVVDGRNGQVIDDVIGAGASIPTAARTARAMARFDDPELVRAGAGVPSTVDVLDVLGADVLDGDALAAAWRAGAAHRAPRAPIAVAADGVVELDLLEHGPHALVAGTTGAGKSELLRTLVASLAARSSPDDVIFVLVDYKGGSAFDACAALPHVVGVVTDLDERLAERALRSLDAEIRRRERVLRAVGATDLAAYRRLPVAATEPMPRLVVVIDEFAGLAADLPDFVGSLVGVAQRGRSLGLHLVLATQRPAGVVNDDIRANCNLRVSLRVQDAADSMDVIGVADAARLPRDRPGRAIVRLGPGDLVHAQVARATAETATAAPLVEVVPMGASRATQSTGEPTTLERLVAAADEAARLLGLAVPRRPWLDPLPSSLARAGLPPSTVALADDPDHQAQFPVAWAPPDGNLLLYGGAGSGTTTALASLALSISEGAAPAQRHLYVVDMGAGDLAPLAGLPHCGAVIRAPERERQARLIRRLYAEMEARQIAGAGGPEIVLAVDGLEALRAAFDDPSGYVLLDAVDRIVTDGAEVGVYVVATADRAGGVPAALTAGVRARWVFRLADAGDARSFGVEPSALKGAPPGRAVIAESNLEMQIGRVEPSLTVAVATVAAAWAASSGGPQPIGVLPTVVDAATLPAPSTTTRPWRLPVGIADADLAAVELVLHRGDHVLVAGRARTGRSTTLSLLAAQFRAAHPDAVIAAVALRPSPLRSCGADIVVSEASQLPAIAAASVVLVDDAEVVDDDSTLATLLTSGPPDLHVVAAGRPDVLRSMYGHWTHVVRRSRLGVLLQPDVDVDGDLLGAMLPRRQTVPPVPGRGYLVVDGRAELIQMARTGEQERIGPAAARVEEP